MTTLMRYQRSRQRGSRTPSNTVYVGRPGKWGNPYKIVQDETLYFVVVGINGKRVSEWAWMSRRGAAREAVKNFAAHASGFAIMLNELQGKNLSCWCKLCPKHKDGKPLGEDCPDCEPCHADVLGRLANGGTK